MKNIKYIYGALLLSSACLSSCVDDNKLLFDVEKPATIASMEYLNDYSFLKTYVDRTANPNFKLGAAVSAGDYNKKGMLYRLVNANFDEITAGNEMKFSSCVGDDGTMNFSTVSDFVKNATEAGLSVYGHTLAWHSQQNNKYLNALIAPIKGEPIEPHYESIITNGGAEGDDMSCFFSSETGKAASACYLGDKGTGADGNGRAFVVTSPSNPTNVWDAQFFIRGNHVFQSGEKFKLTFKVRSDAPRTIGAQAHKEPGAYLHYDIGIGDVNTSTDWKEVTKEVTVSGSQVGFFTIAFNVATKEMAGTKFYFDDVKFEKYVEGTKATWFTDLIANGDCENNDSKNYSATEKTIGPKEVTFVSGGAEGSAKCIAVQSGDNATNSWDSQFFVTSDHVFHAGDNYKFSMWVKANHDAKVTSQAHVAPGGYKHYAMVGDVNFTKEWVKFVASGTISSSQEGMRTIAFNLSEDKTANTYYFDNISFQFEEVGEGTPQTPEEKKDTLTSAMNKWIKGIMAATEGKVKSWDVVNEAISGADADGDGIYDLQSAKNVSAEDAKNNFYWQDYLGSLDYVRIAVKAAREGFAEAKGVPSELKLFINDYNLESDWDDNNKLKSLISWIAKWEADGKTKIDGIGSQMHVSYYADANTQKSKEDHIVAMFNLLKQSNKLVKISELDMGYVDASGKTLKTSELTEAQHMQMKAFYTFIIKKYFEIIPAAQRYGITQWCLTDSKDDSSWRGGEPTGLWDSNYSRKHTYAGFADGLSNK